MTVEPPAHEPARRGDGEAYALALEAAGVAAHHVRLAGHFHASFALTRLLESSRAYEQDAVAALAAAFAAGLPSDHPRSVGSGKTIEDT